MKFKEWVYKIKSWTPYTNFMREKRSYMKFLPIPIPIPNHFILFSLSYIIFSFNIYEFKHMNIPCKYKECFKEKSKLEKKKLHHLELGFYTHARSTSPWTSLTALYCHNLRHIHELWTQDSLWKTCVTNLGNTQLLKTEAREVMI